jgi:hypothetical protein
MKEPVSDERCPACGLLYSIVGRAHNCRGKIDPGPARSAEFRHFPKKDGGDLPDKPRRSKKSLASPSGTVAKPTKRGPRKGTGGRPRLEDRGKTLTATKPWEAAGMSQRTWFRRQKEKAIKP